MRRVLMIVLLAASAFAQQPPAVPPTQEDELTKAVYFGKKFADAGDYASAVEQYTKADAAKPDQPAVLYNLAVVLARAGRYAEAQVKADRYAQLFPTGAEKDNVARLHLELDFQRELQKKRQADQDYADLFNRAKFSYGRGELDAALGLFRQAEQLRPADAAAVYNQGVVFEKQGDFAKAIERFRRYSELEGDLDKKADMDERVFALQHELDDQQSKIVCPFCGRKLPNGATWCERCWHGPYAVNSPVWNSRPCSSGASATRATYFADGRFSRNDVLPCLWKNGSMLETLRWSSAKQREIQNARKAEGWTYSGDVIQGNRDLRFVQGPEYLEKITSTPGGEILTYVAHANGQGMWLLDREDLVVDATRYTNRYTFNEAGRIAQQRVDYQNTGACNHLITMLAGYTYDGDALMSVNLSGSYEGFAAEGAPTSNWTGSINYSYDSQKRVATEELNVTSQTKTYAQKAVGELRDEINRTYPTMRLKKPIEGLQRTGDLCTASGAAALANPVDLRPFYTLSPNLNLLLPMGVTRAVVTFTYPP
ncbi:MAG TPA: tetratricopeptide repeat protein [Thermoanaerobaculia bacterium]|nr:tetratricopeptide repeat protein [Thermoanaerobaculia bacterium]